MPAQPRRARILRGQDADAVGRASMTGDLGLESADGFSGMIDAKLVERVMAEAREAGFQQGYAEGIAQAQAAADAAGAEAERRVARACAAVGAAAAELAARQVAAIQDIEDEVAAIAFEVARAVVGHELASHAGGPPPVTAVARALALAPPAVPVIVRLHPDDLAVVGDPAKLAPGRECTIAADPTVTPGGCIVEAAGSLIDARIEPAIERVRQALLGDA